MNNFLHDDHSLVWKINTSFETVASLTVLWNDQWTKIISALKTARISSTAQGYIISQENEMLCEKGLRRGLSDFWYPGASTSGEGQGDFSKCCHSELGLELAEHRDSSESPATIDCCSSTTTQVLAILGFENKVFPRGNANPRVRPRISSYSHHSPGRTDQLGENAGLL